MRVSKELILREVAGENILIPVGKAALKIHGMICLTETAAFLFGKLQEEHTEAELVDALLTEYEFVEQMESVGILE